MPTDHAVTTPRRVTTGDGVTLAVYETGDPGDATVVLLHGFPDNHHVWDGVAELLAASFHVVRYDTRGAGASDKPGARASYRIDRLVADLVDVLDAVSPGEPVHLVGHDWGSVQAWAAVVAPSLAGRITSYTSISAPSLDFGSAWFADLRHGTRSKLRQALHSTYLGFFQLPALPELAARAGLTDRVLALAGRGTRSSAAQGRRAPSELADTVNGLQLYRANLPRRPDPQRVTIPVQIIVPDRDPWVGRDFAVESARPWVDDLRVRSVAGGHWVVAERPDVIAGLVADFVADVDAGRPAAGSERPAERGAHAGDFVIVTGGARGIGRATAFEFARAGADILVADVDDEAAKQTVSDLRELGVRADAAHLDVGDVAQWEAFAARVREERGVPDVLVNNAGIGMGGPFLGTSAADWSRILNVNLWSVIHGCRLFAAQMVERGQGGRIVNVASAAAFSPSIVYPAYATTKAAVLMLTECLRAELAPESITVTAVCPGFIDTDISASTVHVGVDDDTAARLREHQIASYRRRGYSPDRVARQLVRAATAGAPLAIVTPEARFFRAVSRFAPRLGRRIAQVDLNQL